ncbi:SRPBCC family protein [Chondromyces apiculatus]|uniref:Activator of Hsp90 ATPase 1 family protein n=1 Tax=Chondromyces apiculatus DSM 436 TaxID=1192034 RepID=A0A017TF92_9BACT|nr:SRPBCC domain-containing protein [Chondromyces apiculatus]EYF07286.1 Activator of Hsp90 ATPase 1 family protein [Chondromyces apiculatus DSM 436]
MSVKKEASGRRSVKVEVEVPGTPEQVWQAIATGPGISAWFVPTELEEREGGATTSHFGPGMDSHAVIKTWEPPHRFTAEERDIGPESPVVATEWIVEARSGSTCVVRVVHSLFTDTDDWDRQLEGWESGWPGFFKILRLYLTHFRGQPNATFYVRGAASGPAPEAWRHLLEPLGLAGATAGQHWRAPAGVPPLGGTIEEVVEGDHNILLLRLDAPTSGIGYFFAHPMGGQVYMVLGFYLYGADAAATAARDEPAWNAWLTERFKPAADANLSPTA